MTEREPTREEIERLLIKFYRAAENAHAKGEAVPFDAEAVMDLIASVRFVLDVEDNLHRRITVLEGRL